MLRYELGEGSLDGFAIDGATTRWRQDGHIRAQGVQNAAPMPTGILVEQGALWRLELAELCRTGAFEQVGALGARYGVTRLMDWMPELTTRYQLKLLGQ